MVTCNRCVSKVFLPILVSHVTVFAIKLLFYMVPFQICYFRQQATIDMMQYKQQSSHKCLLIKVYCQRHVILQARKIIKKFD